MQAVKTIVIRQVTAPTMEGEDVYFAAFDADTGEKVAPWADSDTAEEVLAKISAGNDR